MKICHLRAALLAAVVLTAACGVVDTVPSSTPRPHGAAIAAVTFPVQIPHGQSPILHLATDPSKAGVWFTSWSDSEMYAYFYDPAAQKLSTWALGPTTGPAALAPFSDEGLGVDAAGNVWMGADDQLVELIPQSGAVHQWTIPTPERDAHAPAEDSADVTALAALPSGSVVLAQRDASQLTTFDPSSSSFGHISLPAIGQAQGLAVLSDGTIGVAMADEAKPGAPADTLVLITPGGTQSTVQAPSAWIAAAGSSFRSGDGATVDSVSASGATSPEAAAPSHVVPGQPGAALPGGSGVVLVTATGFAVVRGTTVDDIAMPMVTLRNIAVPLGVSPIPSETVPVSTAAMAVDEAGNIWVAPSQPQNEVGVIAAGSYGQG